MTQGDPMTDPGIDAVENQIRQAQARGAFDDLVGHWSRIRDARSAGLETSTDAPPVKRRWWRRRR